MAADEPRPGWVRVHLTMFEHLIEVHESELPNLRSQGLLIEDKPAPAVPPASSPPPAVPPQAPPKPAP